VPDSLADMWIVRAQKEQGAKPDRDRYPEAKDLEEARKKGQEAVEKFTVAIPSDMTKEMIREPFEKTDEEKEQQAQCQPESSV